MHDALLTHLIHGGNGGSEKPLSLTNITQVDGEACGTHTSLGDNSKVISSGDPIYSTRTRTSGGVKQTLVAWSNNPISGEGGE